VLRVGLGFDSHPFRRGRPLVLGGVEIPAEDGLSGHSDADVLTHAVIDALLGASGRGNIGGWFPPGEQAYAGAHSVDLLREVWGHLIRSHYRLVNLDCVLVAEKPQLGPHLPAIRRGLAEALGVDEGAVSVKPKTAEGLGSLGRAEGMAALAVVLIELEGPG